MARVLVTDPIAQEGIDRLAQEADVEVRLGLTVDDLRGLIAGYEALVVRSETKVTGPVIEAGARLQVIGRAGMGVDNIDLETATQRGVVVVNAPLGNTISTAEHAIALMLALARHIPGANASLRQGEWQRKRFLGTELRGKTLGLVGLGQVGSAVARRARALEMRIIAHDPLVSPERFATFGVEPVSLDELLSQADFVSLHAPGTRDNESLIGEEQLRIVKPGVRIINAARGELLDEEALLGALNDGRVAGAAIDVFRKEPPGVTPLLKHEHVIVTPHLGASTAEAQERVAVDVAEQVLAVLRGEPALYAVNAPLVPPETMAVLWPFLDVAEKMASLAMQLCDGQLRNVEIEYQGEIANHDVTPLRAAAIKGLLGRATEEHVTMVNANLVAERRGLRISERTSPPEDYPNLIVVHLHTTDCETIVAGSAFHDGTHVLQVNEYKITIPPGDGFLLICENEDRPGMIGAVGVLLGEHKINVEWMNVSSSPQEGGHAMMVVRLNEAVSPELLGLVEALPDIYRARLAKI